MSKDPFLKKKKTTSPEITGEVREYQLLTSFGIGSIVDFVKDTVIISGVDHWKQDENLRIYHRNLAGLTGVEFFLKPYTSNTTGFTGRSADIPSYIFPEKLYCPQCKTFVDWSERQYADKKERRLCFLTRNDKICRAPLVSARFVVICNNGHMEDFPYSWWVHRNEPCSSGKENPRISMFNMGNRSDIESLYLKCNECEKTAGMSTAFSEFAFSGENGYCCTNHHPHLEHGKIEGEEPCDQPLKTRLRTSSGVYFPVNMSALSIPPWSKQAVQFIENEKETLSFMSPEQIPNYLTQKVLPKVPKQITLTDLLEAYQLVQREGVLTPTESSVYFDEYSVLVRGDVDEDGEYSAKSVETPVEFHSFMKQIVAVDKLTVVQAMIGFTRGTPWRSGNLFDPRIVSLTEKKKNWLPAVKLNGEGIFIEFDGDKLDAWAKKNEQRFVQMGRSLDESYSTSEKFSPQYVFLHSFSHLFIRALSEVCGYNTAAIQEKIYSTFHQDDSSGQPMNGVLIYLASTDSEGSLGGLISVAENTSKFLAVMKKMLQSALWCSGDPLCSTAMQQGWNGLNYAACHDCTLLPETSCEIQNTLLDRVSVVGLAENRSLGFLGDYVQRFL